jgi:hypothetical protein
MLVTEKEAGELWCPFVRHTYGGSTRTAYNRESIIFNPENCRCIASACMMWRWSLPEALTDIEPDGRRGFCGLATRPIAELGNAP